MSKSIKNPFRLKRIIAYINMLSRRTRYSISGKYKKERAIDGEIVWVKKEIEKEQEKENNNGKKANK